MTRIAIIERADMNAEQARVHDAAKQAGGPVGGPYLAYIRVPKLYEAAQTCVLASGPGRCRAASSRSPTSSSRGTGTRAIRGLRRCALRSPPASSSRSSTRSTRARFRTCPMRASAPASLCQARSSPTKGLSDKTYAAAEAALGLPDLVALVATTGSFSMTCMTAATFQVAPPADNPTPLAE